MKEDGTLTAKEEATVRDAIGIVSRWLELHRDEPHTYGYWGLDEARHQLETNIGYMLDE